MINLTKKYFDAKLDKLSSDFDAKLDKLEDNLKQHTEKEVTELAGMVSRRFDEIEKKLDLREEVDRLKVQMKKIWEALNIAQK